jgi:formimidoylglutamate deiminase
MSAIYFARQAWIDGAWQRNVCLHAGPDGHWAAITANQACTENAIELDGTVLPSLVNAHSHAFQRAFAGLAERQVGSTGAAPDDFWTWRQRMYEVALRITPAQMRAIAAKLYVELLKGGYTQVCEFHYLQRQEDGARYPDEWIMGMAVADAAHEAGLGLTWLPVLYARAGFGEEQLRDDQRRFRANAISVWRASQQMQQACLHTRPLVSTGVAVHSLRGASTQDIRDLQVLIDETDLPIHIHISEQQQEVQDCIAATGQRPIAWLCSQFAPDARWQLVHATHSTPSEIEQMARSGAGVVLCPGTEANLGDGVCDLRGWLDSGVPISVGSDSQVTRNWVEELRWLEYGQRLTRRERNVAAASGTQPSTAARLFDTCTLGSAAPAGLKRWGLNVGARADFIVLNARASGLHGVPQAAQLDALVFASHGEVFQDVFVAGRQVVHAGQHARDAEIDAAFASTMRSLWAGYQD